MYIYISESPIVLVHFFTGYLDLWLCADLGISCRYVIVIFYKRLMSSCYFISTFLYYSICIDDLTFLILAGLFMPGPIDALPIEIVEHEWRTHHVHQNLMWSVWAMFIVKDVQFSSLLNSQANYTVKQRANSIGSEFPFWEDYLWLHIDMHAYSGNCWEWWTSVYLLFSLR